MHDAKCHFAQADSIVPAGAQGLDRYAYVNNNPVNFSDPSGHRCAPEDDCDTPHGDKPRNSPKPTLNDPTKLTWWGERMMTLYMTYMNTPEWWNNYTVGNFSLENFMVLILSYEFSPLKGENSDTNLQSAAEGASTRWFYQKCAYETGGAGSGITANAVFDWLGAMEFGRRRYTAMFDDSSELRKGADLGAITREQTANQFLAQRAVASILNPANPGWAAAIPDNNSPVYWGNSYLYTRLPQNTLDIQSVYHYDNWYIFTPNQDYWYK